MAEESPSKLEQKPKKVKKSRKKAPFKVTVECDGITASFATDDLAVLSKRLKEWIPELPF